MSMSDRHSADPALDRFGPKPTDRSLPLGRRTHSAPYLIAILVVLVVGIALIAFGSLRLSESTRRIEATPDSAPPAANLAPDQSANSNGNQAFDRNVEPAPKPATGAGGVTQP